MRLFVLLILCSSCAPRPTTVFIPVTADGAVGDAGVCTSVCSAFGNPRAVGAVVAPLVEISGLVASRAQPGVLYAHNDSGDTPRFFALSAVDAGILQEFTLEQGATAADWEDIALGPCPSSGTCVFLGDIGDNSRVRTNYALYAVPEPMVMGGAGVMSVPFSRLPYAYPQGEKHNAEALIIDPSTGRPYILTKDVAGRPSLVFRFPLPLTPNVETTLELVGAMTVPSPFDSSLTGADVSPCGDAVLVRMYNRLVLLRADATGFESAFQATPTDVPVAVEAQGESVAFSADGRSYFTASETILDAPPLNRSTCR